MMRIILFWQAESFVIATLVQANDVQCGTVNIIKCATFSPAATPTFASDTFIIINCEAPATLSSNEMESAQEHYTNEEMLEKKKNERSTQAQMYL